MWWEMVKTTSSKQHKEAKGWTQHVERSRREVARNNVSQQEGAKLANKRGLGSGKSTGKRQRQEVRKLPPRNGSKNKALPGRLELPTLRLTASRSNQLSYGSHVDKRAKHRTERNKKTVDSPQARQTVAQIRGSDFAPSFGSKIVPEPRQEKVARQPA